MGEAKKIGLITNHRVQNYGAVLQTYALYKILNELENVEVLDYSPDFSVKPIKFDLFNLLRQKTTMFFKPSSEIRKERFSNFLLDNIKLSDKHSSYEHLVSKIGEYAILVSGSDQIWSPKVWGKLYPAFFLAFASEDYKKISYASSLGNGVYSNNEKSLVKEWLAKYSHIGVREHYAENYLRKELGVESQVVLDPTLLLSAHQYRKIIEVKDKQDSDYVLVYTPNQNPKECIDFAKLIQKKIGAKEIRYIGGSSKYFNKKNGYIQESIAGPKEFISLFDRARFVVTSSFHGTAFSVIFNRNFVNILNKREPERAKTLLGDLGIIERILDQIDNIDNIELEIDYQTVNQKLEKLKLKSLDYLRNALDN
ncbi:MAG: polysaccharide pyruvyl transferase family protein [Bacteroidetes bacterium]|nr:polysaccharide pyruvyl transferase family protein [Bacteroidota bacterium]